MGAAAALAPNALPMSPLPLEPIRDDEIVGRAVVGLGDQLQRLDGRELDIFSLDQGRERLGGDLLAVGEGERDQAESLLKTSS